MAPTHRDVLRRQLASAAGKKAVTLLNIKNLKVECELARVAAVFWTQGEWTGKKWEDDMRDSWNRQVWEATSWLKGQRISRSVL